MTNYSIKITHQTDLEDFGRCIRDAVCDAFPEKFGSLRLREMPMRYSDYLHHAGIAHASGIEVRQVEGALDLACTIIHEMGHYLVGNHHNHDDVWRAACITLGLLNPNVASEQERPEDLRPDILRALEDAIARFAKDHPTLVYDANIDIPLPLYIGLPDCPDPTDDCTYGHKVHVKQFQLDGARWMLANPKNILYADDMGLGKTVGMMLYINATHPSSITVVCPNNVKLIWRDHFRFWCVWPDIVEQVEVAHTAIWTFSPYTIMNYEAVRRYKNVMKTQRPALLIFDEMHYLKTPDSQRSQACYALQGDKVAGLSGSPIVNYPEEIFPLIHYLDRDNWPSFSRFQTSYSGYGNRFGRNLPQLNARLRSTIMLRRLKKDVLSELPKKRRQVIQFEVDDTVRKLIEEEKRLFGSLQGNADFETVKMLNSLKNEGDVVTDDIDWAQLIEELKYTKRYAFEEMARIAHLIGKAKVPMAVEHITNVLENREKCVVFGHHRDVLTSIADHFKPHSVLLLGGTGNQAEATAMASGRFSNDDDCTVFVGGITLAAGYSLKGSSTVVFVEEDWVPGLMSQAEDRSHGIGRGDTEAMSLLIQHLVFEDSLDTYKAKLTIRKQKAIDKATGKL